MESSTEDDDDWADPITADDRVWIEAMYDQMVSMCHLTSRICVETGYDSREDKIVVCKHLMQLGL